MKNILKLTLYVLVCLTIFFFSCKKPEVSCEGCRDSNKLPIAIAGPDQVITLPSDSVSLDGSASNDSDGTISEWLWKKISGPASFSIMNAASSKTTVRDLDTGVYRFELKVTDKGNLSATDTVQITVTDPGRPNRPPVANAGADTVIILPANTINLDGSRSIDPDSNISSYLWTKISGPSTFSIGNANSVQTQVTDLVQGVYLFELKVTDNEALFSKDTMQLAITSQPPPPAISCLPTNRPIINLGLTLLGNIPATGGGKAMVSADNKIFFAGGSNGGITLSKVEIFNLNTQTWSTAELSLPRTEISAVACANKVFFAGGTSSSGPSSRVDIYDIATQSWTTAELNEARIRIATATIGNKVFFAGGCSNTPFEWSGVSNKIDIYDLSTNTWSVKILSETKIGFTATTAESKIYFAGGWTPFASSSTSSIIDIYDNVTGTWSASTLNVAKGFHSGIFKNGKIYWGGGTIYVDEPWTGQNVFTCQVEILEMNNQATIFANLSTPVAGFFWNGAFETDNKIGFLNYDNATSMYYVDIYNITTNIWSLGVFPANLAEGVSRIISANNNIYLIAGGYIWKIEL